MSSESQREDSGAIAFAERLLTLLDEASYSTTYKLAVLLALLDLCIEHAARSGEAPSMLTTRQLAEKVIDIYWPQTRGYRAGENSLVLRQSSTGQAEIVTDVYEFRQKYVSDELATLQHLRGSHAAGYKRLVDSVEWKLIEMPLPRLQRLGDTSDPFIFVIPWDESIRRARVRAYQQGRADADFDNRIMIQGAAGDYLVQFGPLLRPLVRRGFADRIVRYNSKVLSDPGVEAFLFDTQRKATRPLRQALRELQAGGCFYCQRPLDTSGSEVDHFIPWCRYPDDTLGNLVLAHDACNNAKRHYIASTRHLGRWCERHEAKQSALEAIAGDTAWPFEPVRTLSVARSIYLHLPTTARLWEGRGHFVPIAIDEVRGLLGARA